MKALTPETLYGNWATLLLATDSAGRIDWRRLEDEIDTLVASHPNGIYSNGTACEFYAQSPKEFVRISELLSDKCERAGIPYQIGVSHPSAQESRERLRMIRHLHPGAVQVILPDWFPIDDAGLSVFVPGHHLATGVRNGARGAYSNVACINPFAAQKWYDQMGTDLSSALELEARIQAFMRECIDPFIIRDHLPNHACDRFMALVGGWADVGAHLRWPYSSIPESYVEPVRRRGHALIPEFL